MSKFKVSFKKANYTEYTILVEAKTLVEAEAVATDAMTSVHGKSLSGEHITKVEQLS